jgi:hypothetical protein
LNSLTIQIYLFFKISFKFIVIEFFISQSKRFKQKSNLLRLNLFLSTIAEFHFHGIKSLRFLRIPKVFFKNQYSVISHWGFRFLIIETLLLSSFIEYLRTIQQRLFYFPSNTYLYGLANSVPKFQANKTEGLTRIKNFRDTYFCPMDVAGSKNTVMTSSNGISWTSQIQFDYFLIHLKISKTYTF